MEGKGFTKRGKREAATKSLTPELNINHTKIFEKWLENNCGKNISSETLKFLLCVI